MFGFGFRLPWPGPSKGFAMTAFGLPSQLRALRWLAVLGRLDEAAVLTEVGLPSGLGAKGRMLMVERVGMALADLCETWPGRRAGL